MRATFTILLPLLLSGCDYTGGGTGSGDASAGLDQEALLALRGELAAFSPELAERPEIVALTKSDAVLPEELEQHLAAFEAALGARPLVVSSVTGEGVDELINECWRRLRSMLPSEEDDLDEID